MRYLIILVTLFALSCSKEPEVQKIYDPNIFPQKWQLVQMSGNIPNSVSTGKSMEWQEHYLFNSDGSFYRKREFKDGSVLEAEGTYEKISELDEDFLVLNYTEGEMLAGSCYSNGLEHLMIVSSSKLQNTWAACDGPGMEYMRVD